MHDLGSIKNTVATLDMLQQTPSMSKGFSFKYEHQLRTTASLLIKKATVMLLLPLKTTLTAQVLLNRFYFTISIGSIPSFDVLGGCIYLASKLEETPKRLREIITVLYFLKNELLQKKSSISTYSSEYQDYREGILQAEITILGKLAFNVHVEHPHGYLMNYLQSLGLVKYQDLSQKAFNYASDAMCGILPCIYQANVIACGCVYIAVKEFGAPMPDEWFKVFDVNEEDLTVVEYLVGSLYGVEEVKIDLDAFIEADSVDGNTKKVGWCCFVISQYSLMRLVS